MQSGERFKRSTKKGRGAIGALILVLLGFGAAVGVIGCTPQETTPPPTPSPTSVTTTPALPTNEEALAIVEELVPKVLAAEGAFLSGTTDRESFKSLATEALVLKFEEARGEAQSSGYVISGAPTADTFAIQSIQHDPGAVASIISFYACLDRSNYHALNAEGNSVRGPDAATRFAIVGTAVGLEGTFQVEGYEAWPGAYSC
ncbi:hypothetical protein [Pseudoclavibacter helvolus]|uniref:Uncharacterized protein n=1 Tax=Pseudoclavibacter helvolus TaxID=255205 RepID=A0A7W4YDP5_9MICO|nr:hypothetical protein [Pseudoclavibacter helvolus]MBB2956312.1 hypothetical protein [Pseudoclavibacter helvolus]